MRSIDISNKDCPKPSPTYCMYLGEQRLKEYTILPQNPKLHTSLDHFCHSIHRCELVTSQNYPAKKKSLSFIAWFKKQEFFKNYHQE